jgi:hypothetical protein
MQVQQDLVASSRKLPSTTRKLPSAVMHRSRQEAVNSGVLQSGSHVSQDTIPLPAFITGRSGPSGGPPNPIFIQARNSGPPPPSFKPAHHGGPPLPSFSVVKNSKGPPPPSFTIPELPCVGEKRAMSNIQGPEKKAKADLPDTI